MVTTADHKYWKLLTTALLQYKITLCLSSLFSGKIICFLMWTSTSLYNSRTVFLQLRLFGLFAFRWTKSHRQASVARSLYCRSHLTLRAVVSPGRTLWERNVHWLSVRPRETTSRRVIASSPYQVISGTNVHNSSKYTTMIHNSKSISCRWYCQCSQKYFHSYKTHLWLQGYSFGREKMYALLVPTRICQTYA